MTEGSKKRSAPNERPKHYASVRFLIEDPATGWRIFSLRKAFLVYSGKLLWPNYGGRTIRVVNAFASFHGRKVTEVLKLEPSEWKLDPQGRIDQEEKMRRIIKKLDVEPGKVTWRDTTTPQLTEADISAIRRCLRLPAPGS